MKCAICKNDIHYGYKSEFTNGADICKNCKIESEIVISIQDVHRFYLITIEELQKANIKKYNNCYFCKDIEDFIFNLPRNTLWRVRSTNYFQQKEQTDILRQSKKHQYNILERTDMIKNLLIELLKKLNNPIKMNDNIINMITVYALNTDISVFDSARYIFDKLHRIENNKLFFNR